MLNKKKIIYKLNQKIGDYKELSVLCNTLSNDIDKVIETINKVIKYAFVKENFITSSTSLYTTVLDLENIKDLEEKYQLYLKKHKVLFFKNNANINSFQFPLDKDIRLSDISGLRLPTIEDIKQICMENIKTQRLEEETNNTHTFYIKQIGFEEVALEHTRPEIVTIDKSFIYYGSKLSGDVYKDYNLLYNDDRYGNNPSNPLKRGYYSNIEEIKKSNDISIRKLGNVNEIKNGRHRIIYILYNEKTVAIPAKVTRRIEDKQFNIILNELKIKYNIYVYKNNILNDQPNVLLYYKEKLYEIRNKEELIKIYDNLQNNTEITFCPSISFVMINDKNRNKIMNEYRTIIVSKYLSVGEKLITNNFTDTIKYFEGNINSVFYDAFISIQFLYRYCQIHNHDFDVEIENIMNTSIGNKKLVTTKR